FSSPLLFLGAPGLIGSYTIPTLIRAGFTVQSGSRRGFSVGGASGIAVDMRDPKSLARAMRNVRTVALVVSDVTDMESLGLNVVAAAKSADVDRILWFPSCAAKPENKTRFSCHHPIIDEAVRTSGI